MPGCQVYKSRWLNFSDPSAHEIKHLPLLLSRPDGVGCDSIAMG
ncbi:hypothetical protein MGWOODY_Mmi973 [hydrothermal vent metagenome]|uniref:Uncharacterized protein n=1 Tax=hydrothermal vent metagenome TaxID=652676 RepID=A0A170QDJ6_9ZZZZ